MRQNNMGVTIPEQRYGFALCAEDVLWYEHTTFVNLDVTTKYSPTLFSHHEFSTAEPAQWSACAGSLPNPIFILHVQPMTQPSWLLPIPALA